MYQGLAKPFKHEVINWLCTYNESTLFVVAMMQTIFITDIRQVSVVIYTGWAMVALTVVMIFVNFAVIFTHIIKNKLRKIAKKKEEKKETPVVFNNMTSNENSCVTIVRHRDDRRMTSGEE